MFIKRFALNIALISTAAVLSAAHADVPYTSQQHWDIYQRSCRELTSSVVTVRKQINSNSEVLFSASIRRELERMETSLAKVVSTDREAGTVTNCEVVAADARDVLKSADQYQQSLSAKQAAVARAKRESSAVYKKAISLGFADYEWLGGLDYVYRKRGAASLHNVMIVPDPNCGTHFKAIQQVGPYVLFAAPAAPNNSCNGKEKVAVLPAEGRTFARHERIDRSSYYIFQGVSQGRALDGFPMGVLLLKQVPLQ